MTLFETIKTIYQIASTEPNINTLVLSGDILDVNTNNTTVRYSAFCCEQMTPNGHEKRDDFMRYGFRLYFMDRLTEDGKNKIEVQSKGIQTLESILGKIRDSEILGVADSYYYSVFTNRFEAWCAGAYAEVVILAPAYYCYDDVQELLGDFNIDFNLDFWVKPILTT